MESKKSSDASNLVTKSEAEMMWCPFARSRGDGSYAINRDYDGNPDTGSFCIADDCMAWRWVNEHLDPFPAKDLIEELERDDQLGFCGLVK